MSDNPHPHGRSLILDVPMYRDITQNSFIVSYLKLSTHCHEAPHHSRLWTDMTQWVNTKGTCLTVYGQKIDKQIFGNESDIYCSQVYFTKTEHIDVNKSNRLRFKAIRAWRRLHDSKYSCHSQNYLSYIWLFIIR